MASVLQTASITCRGGLDQTSTTQELFSKPGFATTLENFEASEEGGYRRINGFSKFSEDAVPGTGNILGIAVYKGVVAARGDAIYHSFDGTSWTQINKVTGTPVNFATLSGLGATARTGAGQYTFDKFTLGTGSDPDLIIRDTNNEMAYLTITGTSTGTATYDYNLITSGSIAQAGIGIVFRNQHFAAKDKDNPATFYVSNTLDMTDFTTGTSASFSVGEEITGIKSFRGAVYIFTENSIFKGTGFDSGTVNIQPVTRKIGCLHHNSIQEVGGDLLFLAPDGLRNLAGTTAIDDIDLSTLSLSITQEVRRIINNIDNLTISSTVIRNKSQYRLFTELPGAVAAAQTGILGTYISSPGQGNNSLAFSTTKGLEVTAIATDFVDNLEVHYHGDTDGFVYVHDVGEDFDGTAITSIYQTPYFDLSDSGLRKNFHDIIIYLKAEGLAKLDLFVLYDFDDPRVAQPDVYEIPTFVGAALYGSVNYASASAIYGSVPLPNEKIFLEGSGMVGSFRFVSDEASAPFNIQGFDVNIITAGRV